MGFSFEHSELPLDYKTTIKLLKKELRSHIGDIDAVFHKLSKKIEDRISEINRRKVHGEEIWPIVEFDDVCAGSISERAKNRIKEHGCVVIKNHFPRERALHWDASILDYLQENKFDDIYKGPGDNFFGTLEASKPEIYPIYWSKAQMEARTDPRMATVQSFLNHLWRFDSQEKKWFDPDINIIYPDRIRRRPPGTTSKGLGAHTDSGALERWLLPEYQKIFSDVFSGSIEDYDPWNAAYRTEVHEYEVPNTTKCSVFRTFQGWTALSDMEEGQGLFHVVPIPEAMMYLLLRPLLDDVPEDELCGVTPGKVLPVLEKWHSLLLEGLCSIPPLEAGDSVWWHCDLIHSVAPVIDQQGWGNVMYIPAAPMCERNKFYEDTMLRGPLKTGNSPVDFPQENYEKNWVNRGTMNDDVIGE